MSSPSAPLLALEGLELLYPERDAGRSVHARRALPAGAVVALYPVHLVFETTAQGRTLTDVHGCASEYHIDVSLSRRGVQRALAGLCMSTVTAVTREDARVFRVSSAFNYMHPYPGADSVCVGQFVNDSAANALVGKDGDDEVLWTTLDAYNADAQALNNVELVSDDYGALLVSMEPRSITATPWNERVFIPVTDLEHFTRLRRQGLDVFAMMRAKRDIAEGEALGLTYGQFWDFRGPLTSAVAKRARTPDVPHVMPEVEERATNDLRVPAELAHIAQAPQNFCTLRDRLYRALEESDWRALVGMSLEIETTYGDKAFKERCFRVHLHGYHMTTREPRKLIMHVVVGMMDRAGLAQETDMNNYFRALFTTAMMVEYMWCTHELSARGFTKKDFCGVVKHKGRRSEGNHTSRARTFFARIATELDAEIAAGKTKKPRVESPAPALHAHSEDEATMDDAVQEAYDALGMSVLKETPEMGPLFAMIKPDSLDLSERKETPELAPLFTIQKPDELDLTEPLDPNDDGEWSVITA